ncbi:MAG: hypothetical protein IKW53_03010 [Clostridia bacterium]|nr:hypothetical protein [Clostridia bacterium]
MKNEKDNQNMHIPYASRQDMILYAAFGVLNIALAALICDLIPVIEPIFVAIIVGIIYLAEIAVIGIRRIAKSRIHPTPGIHGLLGEEGSLVFKNSKSPIIIFDFHGRILWYNDAMREALDSYNNYIGEKISSVLNFTMEDVEAGECNVTVGDRNYSIEGFVVSKKNNGLYLAMLSDVTELQILEKKYNDERVAVAYIAIDNIEDVLQYVHEKFADAVVSIEEKLKNWAASMNGVIKSYDNDKYIMFFDSKYLDDCVENRFEILDSIRDARVGDGMSITVLSVCLEDRELFTSVSLMQEMLSISLFSAAVTRRFISRRTRLSTSAVEPRPYIRDLTFVPDPLLTSLHP